MFIKPAYSKVPLKTPTQWSSLACGEFIKSQTREVMRRYERKMKPGCQVIVGNLGAELQQEEHIDRVSVAPSGQADMLGILTELPIKTDSVDTLISPFTLEFHQHPHQLLREYTRVLDDDGVLVLMGFNPVSPAVASGFFVRHVKPFPWCGRYFSIARMKDWLALLGFDVKYSEYFVPHLLHKAEFQGLDWSSSLCEKVRVFNAAYVLVATKQTLIGRINTVSTRRKVRLSGQQPATAMTSDSFKLDKSKR